MEAMDEQAYRSQMLEYQKAIDWKLWEMLKIMQSMSAVDTAPIDIAESSPNVKPVIVDE